jgi:hypothetical protein
VESDNRDEQKNPPNSGQSGGTASGAHSDAHASRVGSVRAHNDPPTRSQMAEADPDQAIGLSLTGPMPCISCGYDLQGLSVIGLCPECGSAVRATILAKIDPQAEELAPLLTPRLTAYGLAGGVIAGCVATVLMWLIRSGDAFEHFLHMEAPTIITGPPIRWAMLFTIAFAGLCTLAVVRPVRTTTPGQIIASLLAIPFLSVTIWAMHRILFVIDASRSAPYFVAQPAVDRIGMHLLVTASVILALLFVRPSARRLARRSMAMRAGRLNRQTVLAMCGALLLTAVGDGMRLGTMSASAGFDDALDIAGSLLIVVGSLLFTLGVFLSAVDAVRVARVLLRPAPTLRDIVGGRSTQPVSRGTR